MIALGLALILIAGGTTVFAVFASTTASTTTLTAFGVTISASPLAIFLAGALTVILVVLGLALISRGTRRTARKHKELKQLRKDNAIATARTAEARADHGSEGGTDGGTDGRTGATATDSSAKGPVSETTSKNDEASATSTEAPVRRDPGPEKPSTL